MSNDHDDYASLFCGCFGENILDAIDITEGPIDKALSFTSSTTKQGQGQTETTKTPTTVVAGTVYIDDDDNISTTSQSTYGGNIPNETNYNSITFTTHHPPAEVVSIYPTYSVNPNPIPGRPIPQSTSPFPSNPKLRSSKLPKGSIRAIERLPPGQEHTATTSNSSSYQKMMKSLENSYLSMQVELLHGLSSPPGMLEDRIKKRKQQREKQRKQEELRQKKKLEKLEREKKKREQAGETSSVGADNDTNNTNNNNNNDDAHTTAAAVDDVLLRTATIIEEVPTMDMSDDEDETETEMENVENAANAVVVVAQC